jgi:hypothetical protein
MYPRPDPWVEQARRDAVHREARRRKRRRWLFPLLLLLVVVIALAAGVSAVLLGDGDRNIDLVVPAPVTTVVDTTVVDTTTTSNPTVLPEDLVAVDEVWLVDRGDGVFDWGVAVRTQPEAPSRRGVEVTVRLISAGDVVVESVSDTLGVIDADSPAAIAGRLTDPDADPVRIEFDISVGEETTEPALADLLDVRALERDGDEMTGRIRSSASTDISDLRVLFVWHDEAGAVIATAPLAIDVLRPGVDARFTLDLSAEVVPEGRPDAEFWVR